MYVEVSLLALVGTLNSATQLAETSALAQVPDVSHIYGGSEVDACGWPSAVYLQDAGGACTGTLIHPLIVLTAAHCISNDSPAAARFGENASTAQQLVETAYCRQGPGWTGATAQGQDYGYCKLAAPVTTVPIIPVAGGCEQSAIQQGARIMHVGFGVDQDGNSGRKKMLDTEIDFISGVGEILSGGPGEVICNGDSGGPTFVYLDPANGGDGTWRVAAIHSWAQGADPVTPNCNNQAGSVLASNAIEWIEQDSGVDITPCSDGATWGPTAQCGGVPTEPWVAAGNYPSGCTSPEVVEWAAICGPGLDATPDGEPPTVVVVTPTAQQEFLASGGEADVDVDVQATDSGWGVESVELTVRSLTAGAEQVDARNEWQSWVWSSKLPAGSYEIDVVATDYAGNVSDPVTVCFGVGEPGCEGVGEDESGGSSSSGDASGGTVGTGDDGTGTTAASTTTGTQGETGSQGEDESTGGAAPSGDGEGGGCGCATGDAPSPLGLLLVPVLFGLGYRRRRTTARSRS